MRSKFHHEEILRGKDLVKNLANFDIVVCGVGALGSNLVDNLTRQGFSKIKIIDKDRVETHNLNTQVWNQADVGALKVDALKNKVYRNIGVEIEGVNRELTAANAAKLIKGSSLVVDCFDNSAARQAIQDTCLKTNIPCLHCGLEGEHSYAIVAWGENYRVPADQGGDVCDNPMARNLIMLAVTVLSEEILSYCLDKEHKKRDFSITLKDLKIGNL